MHLFFLVQADRAALKSLTGARQSGFTVLEQKQENNREPREH